MKIKLIFFLFLLVSIVSYSRETDSAVTKKVFELCDSVMDEVKTVSDFPALAIADFKDGDDEDSSVALAVSDMVNTRFASYKKFTIVENQQLDKIIETMKFSLTGMYDEKTVASIGNLVGAKYMLLGSVSKLGGFYRISIRFVEVETGKSLSAKTAEIETELLDKESARYLPPAYRLAAGTYYAFRDKEKTNLASFGLEGAFHYDYLHKHSFSIAVAYHMGGEFGYSRSDSINKFIDVHTYLTNVFEVYAGYGYLINVSNFFALKPYIKAGSTIVSWYIDRSTDFSSGYEKINEDSSYLLALNPGVDFLFSYRSPVSFYFSLNYRYPIDFLVFNYPETDSFYTYKEDIYLKALKFSIGLMLYF